MHNRGQDPGFCDDTIRKKKSGYIVKPDQIMHGPGEPTVEKLVRWAAGDGGASVADLLEVFDLSNRHV
jgi:hypothetical protein